MTRFLITVAISTVVLLAFAPVASPQTEDFRKATQRIYHGPEETALSSYLW